MDVGDPQPNDEDDEEQQDQAKDENHVVLALAGKIAFAREGRFGGTFVPAILFHPPDGRFGGLDVGGRRFAGPEELFGKASFLFSEKAFLFGQLPAPGLNGVGIVVVPRHEGKAI